MTFIHKIFCTECDEEVMDIFTHDCPESPENIAKRAEANKDWQDNFDRMNAAWEVWEDSLDEAPEHARYPTMEKPHNIAITGPCRVVSLAGDDGGYGIDYVSPELMNPTWATLTLELEKAIHVTRDVHHCFLEDVSKIEWEDLPSNLKKEVFPYTYLYNLHTGS